jgi:hypothetical protein
VSDTARRASRKVARVIRSSGKLTRNAQAAQTRAFSVTQTADSNGGQVIVEVRGEFYGVNVEAEQCFASQTLVYDV